MGPRIAMALALLAMAGGCDRKAPAEEAAENARAVEMVEAAQRRKPPPVPLRPEPITSADLQANGLSGAGCAFYPEGAAATDPVLHTDATRAVLKVDGALIQLASDNGSGELPYATREHYVGKAFDLRLAKDPGEGVPAGEEAMRWAGSVTVRDSYQRPVYAVRGSLECGA